DPRSADSPRLGRHARPRGGPGRRIYPPPAPESRNRRLESPPDTNRLGTRLQVRDQRPELDNKQQKAPVGTRQALFVAQKLILAISQEVLYGADTALYTILLIWPLVALLLGWNVPFV